MANETKVQAFIHALEEGRWVGRILFFLLLAAIATVYIIVILGQFKGLDNDKGMDQAQIGRQLSTGHGFTTKLVRPIAYAQFKRVHGDVLPGGEMPDTYNAPLNPFVDSLLFRFQTVASSACKVLAPKIQFPGIHDILRGIADSDVEMTSKDIVYAKDRLIAGASLLFFIASVWFNYITAKRLFDKRLALLGMGLLLICDVYWQFALTGLPQNLMVLIFSLLNYCQLRAIENQKAEKNALVWLALSGLGFGLLVLSHGLAIWLFVGALVYMAFAFLPRQGVWWMRALLHPAWVPLLIVAAMEGPWLLRMYHLTGNPFGVALYSGYGQLLGTESKVMRSLALDTTQLTFSWFRSKVQSETIFQFSNIYSLLGHSPIAPVFFVSLLHLFKRPETASFRWCVLYMWIFSVLGMSLFGLNEEGEIHANDLHILFIPMTIFYGLAFILVLWSRLAQDRSEVNLRIVRWSFFTAVYVLSGFPLAHMLITASGMVQWPPYVPPFIAILGQWTNNDEIITSDMPWAVAWYANRKALWLPDTMEHFIDMHDYNRLNDPIVALYLTPVSGDSRFISDIYKGEYKDWAPLILRNMGIANSFPFQAASALQIDGECIIYADRDRWSVKAD